MFDCILPTALAKQGVAFTSLGRRDLRRAAYRDSESALDPACQCYTCKTYPIAYLFHLLKVHETHGWQLIGLHNIHFYMRLMRTMRAHILAGTWFDFYNAQRNVLDARDAYGVQSNHVTKAERRKLALKLGRYEIVVRDGIGRIRDMTSGEVMHSVNDPAEEAKSLYVDQSRLIDRLKVVDVHPLVIWDVGLGAAANAMATIQAVESMDPNERQRRLVLVSFENDLDSLKLALRHTQWFKHLRHPGPKALLAKNQWLSPNGAIDWLLLPGDFGVRKFDAPAPDIVFFDPFSFKTDSALWTLASFKDLADVCAAKATELFTYTYSTRVRAAMLAAGFYVAKGSATGPKAETTIGLTAAAALNAHGRELLNQEWLGKWQRSDAQTPMGAIEEDAAWREAIAGHPQFR
jgi:queuine tRNA-ribosyltransferase